MELRLRQQNVWSEVDAIPALNGILVVDLPDQGRVLVDEIEITSDDEVVVHGNPQRPGHYRIYRGAGRVTVSQPDSSNSVSYPVEEFREFVPPPRYPTAA